MEDHACLSLCKGVVGSIGHAGNLHAQLGAILGSLIERDVEGDVISGALDALRINLLAVDGDGGFALDPLVHTDGHAGLTVGHDACDGRALLVAGAALGHADGEGLLRLELKRNLLANGEDAPVGNLGLGILLGVAALDDVLELLALVPLHAECGIIEDKVKSLSCVVVCVADGEDALVALKTGIAVGVVDTLAVIVESRVGSLLGSARIEGNALDRPLSEHTRIAQQMEVVLVPVEELRVDLVLLLVEDRIGVVQLPERGAAASHGIQVILELLCRSGVRIHGSAVLAVHRVMVVDVLQRNLELMLHHIAVVHGVASIQVTVMHGGATRRTSMVELALKPHRVDPLQQPGAGDGMSRARDPVVLDMVLLSVGEDLLVQLNPGFPHIGAVVHLVLAADHVTLGLRVKHLI